MAGEPSPWKPLLSLAGVGMTLVVATAGATIKFTVDGSTPTAASPTYTGPISVPTTRTLKALATRTGMTSSAMATGAYTITIVTGTVATPTFTPVPTAAPTATVCPAATPAPWWAWWMW